MAEDARQRKARREQNRRVANEKMPPALQLPQGFRMQPGPLAVCAFCERQWKVPEGMRIKLSSAGWALLEDHYRTHYLDD